MTSRPVFNFMAALDRCDALGLKTVEDVQAYAKKRRAEERQLEREARQVTRFWDRVDRSGDCWIWRGPKAAGGYGAFRYRGRTEKAHRIAWKMVHGDIPAGALVLHSCDNPPCVRLEHLRLGTPKDNTQDMIDRGREASGERSGRAVLSAELVARIWELVAAGEHYKAIGEALGVKPLTVHAVIVGKSWRRAASTLGAELRAPE